MFKDCHILSYSLENVPQEVADAQAKVFAKFGIPLEQRRYPVDSEGWAPWKKCVDQVDQWVREQSGCIILVDVDCIPLSQKCITDTYLSVIRRNWLVGPAQRCVTPEGHETQTLVYAGPAMLGFSSDLYEQLDKPTLFSTSDTDVGGLFTVRAHKLGIPVRLLMPTACDVPKWKLYGDKLEFGLGTTFGSCLYHGFEARNDASRFLAKCKQILSKP